MAKKKSGLNNRIVAGIIGAIVVLVVVVPVLQLVLGVDIFPESFEIPVSEQVQIQTNQQIIDEVNNLLCGGGGGTGDPNLIQISSDGTIILDPNQVACIPLGETESIGEEVSPEEIDEMVMEKEEMIIDPPIMNKTTSEDPPIVQLCDQEPENILCQVTQVVSALRLESVVTKIDSTGLSTSNLGVFEIPSLAFLVEDPTDRDFRTGFLELTLRILADEGTRFDVTGTFDVLVNNQTVLSEQIPIQASGIIDESGGLPLSFLSQTGLPSPLFTFDFNANFDNFINEEVNLLEFKVNLLEVTKQDDQFSLVDQTLFEIDIARDDIQLIIVDEQLQTLRVYPTDSRILINTKANTIKGTQCLIFQWLDGGIISGCGKANTSCPCIGTDPPTNKLFNVVAGTAPAPSVTGIILLNSQGQLLTTSAGGTGQIFDELITRNANYTLKTSSPDLTSNLSFGKPQETQSYTCVAEGTAIQKVTVTVTGNTGSCGRGGCNYYYYLVTDGFRIGQTTCNLPTESP